MVEAYSAVQKQDRGEAAAAEEHAHLESTLVSRLVAGHDTIQATTSTCTQNKMLSGSTDPFDVACAQEA